MQFEQIFKSKSIPKLSPFYYPNDMAIILIASEMLNITTSVQCEERGLKYCNDSEGPLFSVDSKTGGGGAGGFGQGCIGGPLAQTTNFMLLSVFPTHSKEPFTGLGAHTNGRLCYLLEPGLYLSISEPPITQKMQTWNWEGSAV